METDEQTTLRVQWILDTAGDKPAAEDLEMQTVSSWEVKRDGIE
jgi:hypothetical protein